MLHFARSRSPVKMQKALANGRLPGALPGAESPANMPIANEHARALAPGKCVPGKGLGITPGKMCQTFQSFADRVGVTSVLFRNMSGALPGVNPWQIVYDFQKKKEGFLFVKKIKILKFNN
jgi:hypothetical protein